MLKADTYLHYVLLYGFEREEIVGARLARTYVTKPAELSNIWRETVGEQWPKFKVNWQQPMNNVELLPQKWQQHLHD